MKYDYEMNFNDITSQAYNIVKFVNARSKVLDIGCATGKLGKYLKDKLNCYVEGIDVNPEYKNICGSNLDKFYLMDVNDPGDLNLLEKFLKEREFDFVILADIIEHLIDADGFLSILSNFTKGYVILSIPNISFWETRLKLLLGIFEYTETGVFDRTHLHFYNLYYARKILSQKFYILDESHSSWYTPLGKIITFEKIPILKNLLIYVRRFLTLLFPNFYASQLIFLLKSKNR